jgi:hypothetical protein
LLLPVAAAAPVVAVVVLFVPFMAIALAGSGSLILRLLETGDLREQGKQEVRDPMFFLWACWNLFMIVGAKLQDAAAKLRRGFRMGS